MGSLTRDKLDRQAALEDERIARAERMSWKWDERNRVLVRKPMTLAILRKMVKHAKAAGHEGVMLTIEEAEALAERRDKK
jgi:hypothetical protein